MSELFEKYKPLLAAKTDEAKLKVFLEKGGTVMGSPKLDGIRCTGFGGVAYSRTKKPLPNKHLQALFATGKYDGFDGEVIVGDPTNPLVYNLTESAVMSKDKQADFKFYVFDSVFLAATGVNFEVRMDSVRKALHEDTFCIPVPHTKLKTLEEVLKAEQEALAAGYEGYMVRRSDGLTKFGRSTANEMLLMKLKRDEDTELEVVGFEEAMHNMNEEFVNELGNTARSSHKENLVGAGRVGAFLVKWEGKDLRVATGKFTHPELEHIFNNQSAYLGKLLKFRYFPHGMLDLPRHPRALGWRDKIDT